MKICTKCRKNKDLAEFSKQKGNKDGLRSACRSCSYSMFQDWKLKNPGRHQAACQSWRKENPDKSRLASRRWEKSNPERHENNWKTWNANNIDKVRSSKRLEQRKHIKDYVARGAKRRASKLSATPKWLSKEQLNQIKQLYRDCPKGYHVDHIMPLNGKDSCGLHVPWNLQILPAKDNLIKSNKTPRGA